MMICMPTLLAITLQTIRAGFRLRLFHLLLGLALLIGIALPLTIRGDGTATGEIQLTLTYTLGLLNLLISASALWVASTSLSREIEGYQMHLVQNSAATRTRIWLGKWLGVWALHAAVLVIAAAAAAAALHWRMQSWTYSAEEREKARNEVLTGRREYRPAPPDYPAFVTAQYERLKAAGQLDPAHNPAYVKGELLRLIKAKSTEVPAGAVRPWRFTGVEPPATADGRIFLRFRHYIGGTSRSSQRLTEGVWAVRDPVDTEGRPRDLAVRMATGSFHEIILTPDLVSKDGLVDVVYINADAAGSSVMFQEADGPVLLIPATGFYANYTRGILLILLQIAFLAALGVTVSGLFSSPVAMFAAAAYLVIGLLMEAAVDAPAKDEFGAYQYKDLSEHAMHLVARTAQVLVVSVDDFDATGDLIRGRLISGEKLVQTTGLMLGLRIFPLALLGVWVFRRRELGLVVRQS